MKRIAFVVCVSILATTNVFAQQDFSKVEIKTTKLAGNLYMLEGQGGAIGVLTGAEGVLMVDSQFAPLTERIVAAIKTIDPGPIRFLINTHVHGDHTGGNANLGALGATIIARPQLRARLEKPAPTATGAPGNAGAGGGAASAHLRRTDDVPHERRAGAADSDPAAHTDGDTLVKFVNADVIMTGDFYRSTGYPNIDRTNGGTLTGMLAGLNKIIELAGPSTRILPGHGAIVDKAAVAAHRDMIISVRDKIAPMVKKGMTVEQVTAAKPTSDYDAKMGDTGTTGPRFVGQLYAELSGAK